MTSPRTIPGLPAMTEADLLKEVKRLADLFSWEFYHPWLSIRSAKGWPDCSLVRPPRFVLAELKSDKGKLRPEQEYWISLLQQCHGLECYVWRPADIDDIVRILR